MRDLRGCRKTQTLIQRRGLRGARTKAEDPKRRRRELDDPARQRRSYGPTAILRKDVEIPQTADRGVALVGVVHEPANGHETPVEKAAEKRLALPREPVRARLPLVHDTPEKRKTLRLRGHEERPDLVARYLEEPYRILHTPPRRRWPSARPLPRRCVLAIPRRRPVKLGVRKLRGISLALALRDGPLPGRSVNGESRPTVTVFIRDVNEQCVAIVLHAHSVQRVAFFFEASHLVTPRLARHERRPSF